MNSNTGQINELHWLMVMLQTVDVGLVVIDRNLKIQLWNSFMENHSGLSSSQVDNQNILELCSEIPQDWFRRKAESVFLLKSRSFCTWEQRPFLFKFKSYRPITGSSEFMFQNVTFFPLISANGEVDQIGMIVYDVTDVAINKSELESANQQLESLSRTDRLTQLYNRGYWEERLNDEFRRSRRTNHPSSLVMFDIDHFKKVNDTYGHPTGDEVIRQTAQTVTRSTRTTDIAGRYGGEEFAIVLINTAESSAYYLAERIRKNIAKLSVEHGGNSIQFTISLGVSEFSSDITSPQEWLERADRALYEAKEGGRNQTKVFKA